jgi:Zn finger protein HypA/HybF involved in hydrogenase expression
VQQDEPYAYAVYFPDQPNEELVHDLEDLCDEMTDREHSVVSLYTHPQPAQQPVIPTSETCKCCGEGQANLVVLRICDKCGSEYAGQAEFDLAMRLQAERQADHIPDAGKMVQQAEQASVKESLTAQAEPVAYRHLHEDGWEYYDAPTGSDCNGCQPLYTHPQPAQQTCKTCESLARTVMMDQRGLA